MPHAQLKSGSAKHEHKTTMLENFYFLSTISALNKEEQEPNGIERNNSNAVKKI